MVRRKAAVEVALFAVGGALIVGSVFAYPLLLRRSGNRVDYYREALPPGANRRGVYNNTGSKDIGPDSTGQVMSGCSWTAVQREQPIHRDRCLFHPQPWWVQQRGQGSSGGPHDGPGA